MAVIHILNKHTAELIAAGEVVERPASAVKELLENAIDAGAKKVTVSIESGGVRLIEVSDDGSGIETEYISTAFIRHATSKIEHEEDLEHIHTLGFRGEALASIASVSRVEVLTKTEQDEFACRFRIEGGEELPIEPCAHGVGTTIRVRDLFYNTPARMKFLKKDASEGTFVADIVGHVALSHPEVSFKFVREGKVQYVTPGDGQLVGAAYAALGREFARGLLNVDEHSGSYYIHGSITPPKSCRASRSMQYFYINGRYVKNRTMMAGLESAFKGTTMQGKFPGCILLLEMPPELVDVNVHPAKTEVRFARENDVFDVVYHAVKGALAQPGSGERMFTFHTPETHAEAGESGPETELPKLLQKSTEDTPNNAAPAAGLSAVTARQAAPGTLQNTRQNDAAMPQNHACAGDADDLEKEDILTLTTVPRDAPIGRKASMASPGFSAAQAFSGRSGGSGMPPLPRKPASGFGMATSDESALDIRPEDENWVEFAKNSSGTMYKNETSYDFGTLKNEKHKTSDVISQEPDEHRTSAFETSDVSKNGDNSNVLTAPVACADLAAQPEASIKKEAAAQTEVTTQSGTARQSDASAQSDTPAQNQQQTTFLPEEGPEPLHYVGEIFKTYILAQRGDELCLIDKHAAHERALFEQLSVDYGRVPGQLLLEPATVNLSAEEKQAVLDNIELLENAGLEVGDYGGATVIVRTVPADVEPTDAEDLLVELADKLAKGSRDALNERTEWVLHSISCRAAIKAGDHTRPVELLALAEKILSGEIPPFCPHGRPCVLKLTRKELEKQFGRIV